MRLSTLAPLGLALASSACDGAEPARGLVVVDPDDPARPFFHDAGTLPRGAREQHVWRLRNTDRVPVTFTSATPACQCTRVKAMRTAPAGAHEPVLGRLDSPDGILTVPAGGEMELVVETITASLTPNVDRLAILRVNTSSKHTPFLTFEIHVKAAEPFRVTPGEIRIGEVGISHGGSGTAQVQPAVLDSTLRLTGVKETSGGLTAELDYLFVTGQHVWTVTATVPPGHPRGVAHGEVLLGTVDEEDGSTGEVAVEVWANVLDDVHMAERLHFGAVPAGEEKPMVAHVRALVPGMRVRVLEAIFEGPAADSLRVDGITARTYADADGRSSHWEVELVAGDDLARGPFEATLVVRLDDEQYPELRARVQGVVR